MDIFNFCEKVAIELEWPWDPQDFIGAGMRRQVDIENWLPLKLQNWVKRRVQECKMGDMICDDKKAIVGSSIVP